MKSQHALTVILLTVGLTLAGCLEQGQEEHKHNDEGENAGEGAKAETALTNPASTTRTENGKTITHVGDEFTGVQTVKVSDFLAKPEAYEGKNIAIEGDIAAMCTHKRAWFAVAAEDNSGGNLRIFTTPTFLVPEDSIGKFGRAEGKVEAIEVPGKYAKYMAKEHKLGDPDKIDENSVQKNYVLRASGADFM
jgi:hypothetical protein